MSHSNWSFPQGEGAVEMKTVIAAVVTLVCLYFFDQEFAAGKYTDAAKSTLGHLARSFGF
jgi:hypothetical protein